MPDHARIVDHGEGTALDAKNEKFKKCFKQESGLIRHALWLGVSRSMAGGEGKQETLSRKEKIKESNLKGGRSVRQERE